MSEQNENPERFDSDHPEQRGDDYEMGLVCRECGTIQPLVGASEAHTPACSRATPANSVIEFARPLDAMQACEAAGAEPPVLASLVHLEPAEIVAIAATCAEITARTIRDQQARIKWLEDELAETHRRLEIAAARAGELANSTVRAEVALAAWETLAKGMDLDTEKLHDITLHGDERPTTLIRYLEESSWYNEAPRQVQQAWNTLVELSAKGSDRRAITRGDLSDPAELNLAPIMRRVEAREVNECCGADIEEGWADIDALVEEVRRLRGDTAVSRAHASIAKFRETR